MRQLSRQTLTLALLGIIIVVFLGFFAKAQDDFTSQITVVKVYKDGLVHITQNLTLDELTPEINLSLLASSIENLIILDANQLAVDYELDGSSLTVFSLGATQITIEYDTATLTNKQAEVWTVNLNNPHNASLFLPENSTIVYLNQVPAAIDTSTSKLSLVLNPSQWEISYIMPVNQADGTPIEEKSNVFVPIEYLIVIVVITAIIVGILVLLLTRKRKINVNKTINSNPHLSKEDKAVLEFLAEKDGEAFEAEIRQRFPDVPRTSLWRLIRRLEKSEIIEIEKIGLENQVKLKK